MSNKDLNISYDAAKQKVENILQQLQDPELRIEDMNQKVEEAIRLIKYCENSLKKTKEDIDEVLTDD